MSGSTASPSSATASVPGDGQEAVLDVRAQRTRTRLREAVLRLARERPVEEIAVADLVRDARVNRTTFYNHVATPAAVLEQVLYEELDQLRADWIEDTLEARRPADEVWKRASEALIDHLERYDAVYTTGLVGQRSPALHRLLVEHFTASVRALLDREPGMLPLGPAPRSDSPTPDSAPASEEPGGPVAWRREAYSRFVAYGEVGIVEAWLALPSPRDPHLFVSAAETMLPDWLSSTGAAGPADR
ncbi:TetR/AcrR family transcriptional regulator [Streptomyces sp. NPDC090106]|uniref:TetR/AcrR family transcriptional regulator n=1 Tax=Streptomyces sp. NPDC090106 TaxID=3365946 RepID=UPI00381AFD7C